MRSQNNITAWASPFNMNIYTSQSINSQEIIFKLGSRIWCIWMTSVNVCRCLNIYVKKMYMHIWYLLRRLKVPRVKLPDTVTLISIGWDPMVHCNIWILPPQNTGQTTRSEVQWCTDFTIHLNNWPQFLSLLIFSLCQLPAMEESLKINKPRFKFYTRTDITF